MAKSVDNRTKKELSKQTFEHTTEIATYIENIENVREEVQNGSVEIKKQQ